jgi:ferritin
MPISPEMAVAINDEIGKELEACHLYMSIASYVDGMALKQLSGLMFSQSDDERTHAMKFINYLLEVDAEVKIPAVPAPPTDFASVEAAIQTALDWEIDITNRINDLVTLAAQQKDYSTQEFLQWFVMEQREELNTTGTLLKVVKQAGERSLLMVEAYLIHQK